MGLIPVFGISWMFRFLCTAGYVVGSVDGDNFKQGLHRKILSIMPTSVSSGVSLIGLKSFSLDSTELYN